MRRLRAISSRQAAASRLSRFWRSCSPTRSLVSRDMVEDLLRFERLDGAQEASTRIPAANFEVGDARVMRARLGELGDVPVQVIWGADDKVIPGDTLRACRAACRPTCSRVRATCHMGKSVGGKRPRIRLLGR